MLDINQQRILQQRMRRKFNTFFEPTVANENESVFRSGPLQQWPTIVHIQPVGPCATVAKDFMAPDAS